MSPHLLYWLARRAYNAICRLTSDCIPSTLCVAAILWPSLAAAAADVQANPDVAAESLATTQDAPLPFAFADFSWMPGNAGAMDKPLSFGPVAGELRVDTAYHYSFANPQDDTLSGSSEAFRHGEVQLTQLGVGGDVNYGRVQARLMSQFGLYSQTTPRNDATPGRGQWRLDDALRYLSEAYGGYHFDVLHGLN
ncbi:MAG: hypothetical protein EOO40_06810, partial [Deltaproteobacteria bacterium]